LNTEDNFSILEVLVIGFIADILVVLGTFIVY